MNSNSKQLASSTKKETLTVGLLWHSLTSDNLGVGALTESQIAICNAAAKRANVQLQFVVVGTPGGRKLMDYDGTVRQGNPVSIRRTIRGDAPYLDDMETCDLVLDIGEGDSFTDIYGLYRFAFLWGSKFGVLRRKVPLVLSPQTIGPFKSPVTRFLAARVMRRCTRVYARDALSTTYLSSMGIDANKAEAIDVAFRLPYTKPESKNDGLTHIGLNVSGLLMSGGYTGSNQFGLTVNYGELIRSLIKHWLSQDNHVVWLIPHVVPDNLDADNDMVAIAALFKEFPNCKVPPKFDSPSAAKSFISGMDFLTGARMHACIAAISSGVPVVPLSYSRKFNGLFNTLGYSWLADGTVDSTETAVKKILDGASELDRLRADVSSAMRIAEGRLMEYESFLADYFTKLASK